MIAVDTSAIIAILFFEAEADGFLHAIARAEGCVMSAVSLQEASMVVAGTQGTSILWNSLDAFIERSIEIVPFDDVQARLARDAFLRYGKGRHPAALNLGDCAAYALAASQGVPLLFKGEDFRHTDIVSALPHSNAH